MSINNEQVIYIVMQESTNDSFPVEAWRNEIDAEDSVLDRNANLTEEDDKQEIFYYVERTILKGYENPHVE